MNFKFLIFLFICASCGVKGDPIAPKTPALPSLMENYPEIKTEQKLEEFKRRR